MGDLLTVTFFSDDMYGIKIDSEIFCRRLYDALLEGQPTTIRHEGAEIIVQRRVPDNFGALYVQLGNTVTEMNAYSPEMKKQVLENREFFMKRLDYLKGRVKELEELVNKR